MARHRLVAILVLVSVVPIYPLALATPIDPSYPGGFYDNGDLDEVIDFLCRCSVATTPVRGAIEPWWTAVAPVREDEITPSDPPTRGAAWTRAPPDVPPPY